MRYGYSKFFSDIAVNNIIVICLLLLCPNCMGYVILCTLLLTKYPRQETLDFSFLVWLSLTSDDLTGRKIGDQRAIQQQFPPPPCGCFYYVMVLFSGRKVQGVRNHHSQLHRASGYNKHKHRSTRYVTTPIALNFETPKEEIFGWLLEMGVRDKVFSSMWHFLVRMIT